MAFLSTRPGSYGVPVLLWPKRATHPNTPALRRVLSDWAGTYYPLLKDRPGSPSRRYKMVVTAPVLARVLVSESAYEEGRDLGGRRRGNDEGFEGERPVEPGEAREHGNDPDAVRINREGGHEGGQGGT